jgi:predicted RNA-binding Zn ribbon-like protein
VPLSQRSLATYESLLQWGQLSGHWDEVDFPSLSRLAQGDRAAAEQALERARTTREVLHSALVALRETRSIPAPTLRALDECRRIACGRASPVVREGRLGLVLPLERCGLDQLADTLVLEALRFFADLDFGRLRRCAGSHCGWYFVDTSKAGRRRWCDMATCGNAEKARRHQRKRARKRRGSAALYTRIG